MLVSDYITKIRIDVNDLERDWYESDEALVAYLNEGLCLAFSVQPETFAKSYVMKLQPGDYQEVGECCKLIKVDAITNSQGGWLADVKLISKDVSVQWRGYCCPKPASADVSRNYYLDGVIDNAFYIRPPVPTSPDVYVRVVLACKPESIALGDTAAIDAPCEVFNAAYQWALHRALSTARDSQSALTASNFAKATCYELLKITMATDDRLLREQNAKG